MKNSQKNINQNTKAIAVGFFLILAVFAVTLFRIRNSSQDLENSQKIHEDISKKSASLSEKMKEAEMTSEILAQKINALEDLVVFDIRDPEAFAREHILDSKNLVPQDVDKLLKNLDKGKACVIVADQAEDASALANNVFRKNGFYNTFYLKGGFSQWKNELNPTVTLGDPASFSDQSKVTYINTDELKKLMESDENIALVDLRKSGQYAEGHLKDTMNIYLGDLEKKRSEIPRGRKVVLYDNDGLWAFQGAVALFDMGIANVLVLSDGLDAWKNKNYEIVK